MKLVIKTAAVAGLLALASSGAMAQTAATGTVNVTATVAATCTMAKAAAGVYSANAGQLGVLDFSPASGSTISTTSSGPTTALPTAQGDCNTPTHITLASANGAAISASAVAAGGGYQNYFTYTATASFTGSSTATATLNANSTTGATASIPSVTSGSSTGSPAAGAITISVTPAAAQKVAAGTFADVLTVTLTAN